jgi:hypothetical protein
LPFVVIAAVWLPFLAREATSVPADSGVPRASVPQGAVPS